MQIFRLCVSFRRTVSNKNTNTHINNLIRSFSIQEKRKPHQKHLQSTALPNNLEMEIADKQAQELGEFIRATHGKLRNEYRKAQDADTVWSGHVKNKEELQQYAAAMHKLAGIWEAKFKEDKDYASRLNWCYQAVNSYFRKGELEKTRIKELRTVSFHFPNLVGYSYNELVTDKSSAEEECSTTAEGKVSVKGIAASTQQVALFKSTATEELNAVSNNSTGVEMETTPPNQCNTKEEGNKINDKNPSTTLEVSDSKMDKGVMANTCSMSSDSLNPPSSVNVDHTVEPSALSTVTETTEKRISERPRIVYGDRLKVLDVGSCYNPFSRYPDLDVTALDLQPATEDVYQCDFLRLNVADEDSSLSSASPTRLSDQTIEVDEAEKNTSETKSKVITTLPANSYDAILFSFFLSYIPSPEHRLICCKNAYQLLKPEGTLVIAAADSRGLIGNGYIYKCWQITMASLGFVRTKYEKFRDFHGMVFRKGMYPEMWQLDGKRKLEELKAKKTEMEAEFVTYKERGFRYSSRRMRQVETFELDKALSGLWLPHDFKASDEEEYIVKSTKVESPKKRKRKESTHLSEKDADTPEPVSKISKSVDSSGECNPDAEQQCQNSVPSNDKSTL